MKKKSLRSLGALLLLAVLICTLLSACKKAENTTSTLPDTSAFPTGEITGDLESGVDYENATNINLTELTTDKTSGVSIKDSIVSISAGGTYIFTGTLPDGQVTVDADKEDV